MASLSVAAASSSLSFSFLSKPSLILKPIRAISRISLSLSSNSNPNPKSSSSSSLEFNITFAPSKPKPESENQDNFHFIDRKTGGQLFIPWIVRGEDGNLKLHSDPPSRILHSLAEAETKPLKKKQKEKEKEKKVSDEKRGAEPKYSKAARRYYNEHIKDTSQRLSKVLAASGVASRRSSEELIFEGRVTVNGSVCNTPQTRVDPAVDVIYVNGNRLPKKLPPKVYLALNKPKGYICSSGEKESKSVMSLFDDYLNTWNKTHPGQPKPRLFTVGRLDVATTGLIIVTNDGDFAQSISHPSSGLSKEYIAAIDGAVSTKNLLSISEGTIIDGVHCTPDSVELLPKQPDVSRPRLRIVVHEGRNHEVRELVKSAGLEIHSLKRVRIGGFRLPSDLGLGSYTALRQSDLKAIGWKS